MQILVILYIDVINNVRDLATFVIMNRKPQELYERIFISIKYYFTFNNKQCINIKTAAIDFEKALLNSFNIYLLKFIKIIIY